MDLQKFEAFTTTGLEYFDPGSLRITRKGRNNFVISGDFTFMKNMGDETFVSQKRMQRSEFVIDEDFFLQMMYEMKKKSVTGNFDTILQGGDIYCQYLNNDKTFWPKIGANSNLPNPAPCPFPKVSLRPRVA